MSESSASVFFFKIPRDVLSNFFFNPNLPAQLGTAHMRRLRPPRGPRDQLLACISQRRPSGTFLLRALAHSEAVAAAAPAGRHLRLTDPRRRPHQPACIRTGASPP